MSENEKQPELVVQSFFLLAPFALNSETSGIA